MNTVATVIPPDTGAKARALRATLLDAIGSEDVAEVVAAITAKAKAGDVAAAKVFLSLLGAK